MEQGVDLLVPVGYQACPSCGQFHVTGRRPLCGCAAETLERSRTLEIVHEVDGRPIVSRPTRARKPRRRKLTAADREQRRLWNKARGRAMQRVVRLNHDLYLTILSEEKAALGLDPRVDIRPPGSAAIERELRAV